MDIFSWSDGVKGNLNQALVSLCLVLCMLVVFISCCLGFISCHIVVVAFGFASVSQVIGWEDRLRTCIIIIIIIFIIFIIIIIILLAACMCERNYIYIYNTVFCSQVDIVYYCTPCEQF